MKIGTWTTFLAWHFAAAAALQPFPHQHEDILGWKALASEDASKQQHGSPEYAQSSAEAFPDIHNGTILQPLDHRKGNATSALTFQQRYWYSLRHYKPPSQRSSPQSPVPLIILEGGETDATARLSYLDHGIVDILAAAVGGIGVVLEHRYYGTSYPARDQFPSPGTAWGVEELQWLNNWQAEQDSVEFARNIELAGVSESVNNKASPVISYGGSYAGARAAHLRLLYPDDFHGAIASSAVTAALEDYPEYMYGVARGNNVHAIQAIEAAIASIDAIIAPEPSKGCRQDQVDLQKQNALLDFVGLDGLTDVADFADLLMAPLGAYQSVNWDDTLSPPSWAPFISTMASNPPKDALSQLRAQAESLQLELPDESLRLLSYINTTYTQPCRQSGSSADDCIGSHNYTKFIENPKLTKGKAWMYQVCTTWGYFITSTKLPEGRFFPSAGPKLISSLLDHEYVSKICRHGFPSSSPEFAIPAHPRTYLVNDLGGFNINEKRLAFIDGQYDPWREATVHSESYNGGGRRGNTLEKPFWVIPNGTHHWDENGLPNDRGKSRYDRAVEGHSHKKPKDIEQVHDLLVDSVKSWIADWEREREKGVA